MIVQRHAEVQMNKEITSIDVTPRGKPSRCGCGRPISRTQPLLEQPAISQPGTGPITNFQVSLLDKFSFEPDDWPKWIQRFKRFCKAAGLDKQCGKNQVNTLISAMGDQADDTLLSFELTPEQEKDYEQNYFIVKRNFIFKRAKFNSRKQQVEEPVDNFITDLHNLARYLRSIKR